MPRFVPLVLFLLAAGLSAAESLPPPSANQGRAGVYQASTSHPGCDYVVHVPKSYAPENPAGIHVFFHGLGGNSMAANVMLWAPFTEGSNCIGINMAYADNNPHVDKVGKMEAAREAVRQVAADYHVLAGRGAMTAFSAGGSPAGAWLAAYGQQVRLAGIDWPFHHVTVFGSGLNAGPELTPRACSWLRVMGDGEEGMAPGLYASYLRGTLANLGDEQAGACPDVGLLLGHNRGHTILPTEVAWAAEMFRRSALMHAPFIEQPPGVDADLEPILSAANNHAFGAALRLAEKGRHRAIGEVILPRIRRQMDAQVALCRELAASDPVLACSYAEVCLVQFARTDALKAAEKALAPVFAAQQRWQQLRAKWAEHLPRLMAGRGLALDPEAVPFLQEIGQAAGERSQIGRMAGRYLAFAR